MSSTHDWVGLVHYIYTFMAFLHYSLFITQWDVIDKVA